jgi:hypothetical protein
LFGQRRHDNLASTKQLRLDRKLLRQFEKLQLSADRVESAVQWLFFSAQSIVQNARDAAIVNLSSR